MKGNKRWLFSFIFMFSLVMVGCSTNSDETTSEDANDSVEGSETTGDELRIASSDQPPTMDYHISTRVATQELSRLINETLLTVNSNYEIVPMLAESVETSDDGKTYTFHLREGIHFHNGEEMTSEDVVASLNRWKEHYAIAREQFSEATFESVDPYTVELKLEEPMADSLDILAAETAVIMPKEIVESAGSEGVTEHIGTGPFKFVEWQQDQYIHFTKFDDYQPVDYEADGISGHKEALVDDIYFDIVPDSSTKLAGIQTGEYDIGLHMPTDSLEEMESNPDIETYTDAAGKFNLMYNKAQGLAADVNIRQAINAALNKDEIMMAAFPHDELHSVYSGYMDSDNEQWASDAGAEAYNQKDPEKAEQLLDEAGYSGEELTLLTHREVDFLYDGAVVIQQQLEQIGMNVELNVTDSATVNELRTDPEEWDLLMATTSIVTTPSQLLEVSADWVGWMEDPEVTRLLESITYSTTQEEAKETWDELQEYAWTEYLPLTKLGDYSKLDATTSKVEGYSSFAGVPILWNTQIQE